MTTLPDETISAAPRPGKQTTRLWLDIVLLILLAATMLSLPVGGHILHGMSGTFLLIGCSVHLAMHGRWIKAVILDTPKNITPGLRRQRRLFGWMFISGFLSGISGLAGLPLIHLPHMLPIGLCCGGPVHILSGLVFLGVSIYHLGLHRSWFRRIWPQ